MNQDLNEKTKSDYLLSDSVDCLIESREYLLEIMTGSIDLDYKGMYKLAERLKYIAPEMNKVKKEVRRLRKLETNIANLVEKLSS